MPELTLAPGLLADTTNPAELLIKLDPASVATPAQLDPLERKDQKGVPGGYAPLGADNRVPADFLPAASGGTSAALLPFFDVRDYGAAVGNVNNASAFQAAINAAEAAGGGRVFVPQGEWLTGPLVLGNRVWLEGAGMYATRLKLIAGANADFITVKQGSVGVPNAQMTAVLNLTLDGNMGLQTSGRGIVWTQNPDWGQQPDDDWSDARQLAMNVMLVRIKGDGVFSRGRSENRLINVNTFYGDGNGFVLGADTFVDACAAGAMGLAGFVFTSPSVRVTNSKAFYCGRVTPTSGHGFLIEGTHGVNLSGCEAQDNQGAGLRLQASAHRNIISSFVADSNSKRGKGLHAGVEVSASRHNKIDFVSFERNDPAVVSTDPNFCPQRHALKLETGATFNQIDLTHSALSGGPVVDEPIMPSSNTAALFSNNKVSVNGQGGFRQMGYLTPWRPEVYSGSTIAMTLTGNTSVFSTGASALTQAHPGSELEIIFTQDAIGGREVAFASQYVVSGSINPAPNASTVVRLTYNGTVWVGAWERTEPAAASGGLVVPFKSGQWYGNGGNEFNTNARAPGNLVIVPFAVTKAVTLDAIATFITTASAGNCRLGIYSDDNGYPGARLLDGGLVTTGTSGHRETLISTTLQSGLYWLASLVESGSATFRSMMGINPLMPAFVTSGTLVNGYEANSVAAGSLPATAPASMAMIGASTRVVVRAL